jgi:uncharacterized membrane protein
VDDHERVKTVIRSDVPNQAPLAGEVPFFLGVNHMNAIKAADDVVDVQLLVRTLDLDKVFQVRR